MSEATNPLRRVPFPEAGAGRVLCLRNRDFRKFSDFYGPKYAQAVEDGLLGCDHEVVDLVFKAALKEDDGITPVDGVGFDDFDSVPIHDIVTKLLDSYSLSFNGRTYEAQLRFIAEAIKKAEEDGRENAPSPMTSPAASSAGSTEPPPGLESQKPNSGT